MVEERNEDGKAALFEECLDPGLRLAVKRGSNVSDGSRFNLRFLQLSDELFGGGV